MEDNPDLDEMITSEQACRLAGTSHAYLRQLRHHGKKDGPAWTTDGYHIWYARRSILEWDQRRRAKP